MTYKRPILKKIRKLPDKEPKGNVSYHINIGNKIFSIQKHKGTYGYESQLFEVGIWKKGTHKIEVSGWKSWEEVKAIYYFLLDTERKK